MKERIHLVLSLRIRIYKLMKLPHLKTKKHPLFKTVMAIGVACLLSGTLYRSALAEADDGAGAPFTPPGGPRARVIILNDLAGDPDGLFATVHALLSPSTEVRAIIGTLGGTINPADTRTAEEAQAKAVQILTLMGLAGKVPTYAGSNTKLMNASTPVKSAGAAAIVSEAMRTDNNKPLYVTVGGSLTDVASALIMQPAIADKFTLVWIGGAPYPAGGPESNFSEDPIAAQVVFNSSKIPIWQVPQNAYAQCMVSRTEIQLNVQPYGAIGAYLSQSLVSFSKELEQFINTGETWTLGDSPLVLLTALTQWFDPTGTGSVFASIPAPHLNSDGTYGPGSGRLIRVYSILDTRLLFSDFFAKMRINYGDRRGR
jgi:purine nucleosidase